jgi:hypothetical protein
MEDWNNGRLLKAGRGKWEKGRMGELRISRFRISDFGFRID